MSETVLDLHAIEHSFRQAGEPLHVLRGCDLAVHAGETVALIGPSGSGKSTFLHIAGLLERPDAGTILIAGQDASRLNDLGRTALRRQAIGFVYQYHHLLPEFSALENIMIPQMIANVPREQAKRRAAELLEQIELTARASHRPAQLSGGEQQRVALARALANNPRVLIADEPTGNLDPSTAEHIFALLRKLTQENRLALLMATHNHELARRMSRTVTLRDGHIIEEHD
ncbi:MAG: ABC transporter ATP-binding protein [Bdellovibrionales bacterium]